MFTAKSTGIEINANYHAPGKGKIRKLQSTFL